jgi:hypothetical protein
MIPFPLVKPKMFFGRQTRVIPLFAVSVLALTTLSACAQSGTTAKPGAIGATARANTTGTTLSTRPSTTLSSGKFVKQSKAALERTYPNRSLIGTNLSGIADWSTQWVFTDIFKTARPWKPGDELKTINFDERGNAVLKPGQSVSLYMLTDIQGHHPAGIYTVLYDGKGKLETRQSNVTRVVKEEPGRIEVELNNMGGAFVPTLTATDASDPLRNIRVYMPGFMLRAAAPPPLFHPSFLERTQPFGTIRFMDFQSTNNSPIVKWSERARVADARYGTEKGVPVEVMIDLANTLQADPWFCMPHLADDDYVRNFAKVVKERLDPNLKAYIEYSNEVWNSQFAQARYALQKGRELKLSDNDFQSQLYFHSRRSVEIFKIWEEVFGAQTSKRVVRTMGSFAVNAWSSEQVLGYQDAYKHTDALAIAPYFGHSLGDPKRSDEVLKKTPEVLLAALEEEVKTETTKYVSEQAAMAKKFNVQLVAYEGGQHIVGIQGAENNDALTKRFHELNRHPRMEQLYKLYFKTWFDNGGGLFANFSSVGLFSKWGSWGVLEYQDQPIKDAPKFKALIDLLRAPRVKTSVKIAASTAKSS